MVDRASQYYDPLLQGSHRVTQQYPLSPTIFNMVVDSLIRNWVVIVTGEEAGPVRWLAEFFYADNGLLSSPQPSRLQAVLNLLTGIFDRMGLHKNLNNMVEIVCHTC